MPEPVAWQADGTPRSPRFNDIYRSRSGALAQARHVFLQGCGLPAAWAGQPQWRILETGFGLGTNFLAAWRAWKDDPQRPRLLHFVSVEAWPVSADDLLRSAQSDPELNELAQALAEQWFGLLPGVHRLVFEGGHVLLTLCVGDVKDMLREQEFQADSLFLDGFDPERNPVMWEATTLKAAARCCRRGAGVATWTVHSEVRAALAQHGFIVAKTDGLPPKRHCLRGEFMPAWEPRRPRGRAAVAPGDCLVIGAGLAGAAVAASLARRGWQVLVLDAAAEPASGASGLPAGIVAPQASPDDNLLSRLSRSGVRATLQQAQALLQAGRDWQASGVLAHRVDEVSTGLSAGEPALQAEGEVWTRPATAQQKRLALLPDSACAHWHEKAAWIQPARLVQAWLAQPGVRWQGGAQVARLVRVDGQWQALDHSGACLGRAPLVVVAAAWASGELLDGQLLLQPVRGQVSWAMNETGSALPPFPVNGHGSFIPAVPLAEGSAWVCGASFDRGDTALAPRPADQQANLERLQQLLPAVAQQLAPAFASGRVRAWTGVRCASTDRRPLVGPLDSPGQEGLWVSTAMGSRGLTFAALCAELLAARLHGEPLPLARRLAQALSVERQKKADIEDEKRLQPAPAIRD